MITVKDVTFHYHPDYPVIKHMNVSLNEHENVGIIGANGAGKSTLLKLLVGILLPQEGNIIVCRTPLSKKTVPVIRTHLGFVFQDSDAQLFMPTVYDDVAFGPRNQGLSQEEADQRTKEAMSAVGIDQLSDRMIYHLSGGEKKLVSLATVLAMQPDILLFDEPTIALDPRNRKLVINVINQLDNTKIITSHDLDLIYDTCERVIVIDHGEIVADGSREEILHDQMLLESHGLELPLSLTKR